MLECVVCQFFRRNSHSTIANWQNIFMKLSLRSFDTGFLAYVMPIVLSVNDILQQKFYRIETRVARNLHTRSITFTTFIFCGRFSPRRAVFCFPSCSKRTTMSLYPPPNRILSRWFNFPLEFNFACALDDTLVKKSYKRIAIARCHVSRNDSQFVRTVNYVANGLRREHMWILVNWFAKFKEGFKVKKRFGTPPDSWMPPKGLPQVGGQLLVYVYEFLTSNSNFKTTSNLENLFFSINFTYPLRKTNYSQIYPKITKTFTQIPNVMWYGHRNFWLLKTWTRYLR